LSPSLPCFPPPFPCALLLQQVPRSASRLQHGSAFRVISSRVCSHPAVPGRRQRGSREKGSCPGRVLGDQGVGAAAAFLALPPPVCLAAVLAPCRSLGSRQGGRSGSAPSDPVACGDILDACAWRPATSRVRERAVLSCPPCLLPIPLGTSNATASSFLLGSHSQCQCLY
jgi:hypothetical protein